ncbi:methyltransferase, FkbM family [Rhizobiales bacterium GAS191]|nr:methyltransferase, FkbM family [Rhizobiales bacterium GAS191]
MSPGAQLSVLSPRGVPIDPVHQTFIARWVEPTSIVWDVGGNMGLFSFPAALKAHEGRVYTFEPDVELARNLVRGMRRPRNRALPITVFSFALSDMDGTADFLIARHGRCMNKLDGVASWHDNLFETSETRSVGTFRIDTIAKSRQPPGVLKIDVEGAEMKVLEGGRETIAKHKPVILIEGPRDLWPQMAAFFKDLNYVLSDGRASTPVALETPVWDTVAVPREKWG